MLSIREREHLGKLVFEHSAIGQVSQLVVERHFPDGIFSDLAPGDVPGATNDVGRSASVVQHDIGHYLNRDAMTVLVPDRQLNADETARQVAFVNTPQVFCHNFVP
ncbi:hypothetical protein D3C77_637950 [compost metagenome]